MEPILPELIIVAGAFLLLAADLIAPGKVAGLATGVAAMTVTGAFLALTRISLNGDGIAFGGRFVLDPVGFWLKVTLLLAALVVVSVARRQLTSRSVQALGSAAEFLTVLLFTLAGMMALVSARDLVTLYVALELATIPLFLLAAWRRDDGRSGEAGLKYVLLGALASAFLLYGLGLLYGVTGTTDLSAMAGRAAPSAALWWAGALIVAGVGFKLTLVPFHLWAADVYEGSPLPVAAWLAAASKVAAMAFLMQLAYRPFLAHLGGASTLVAVIAAVTMTAGNLGAIAQRNVKRFMAFSGISQAGYLLLGFLDGAPAGVPAMLYYLLVYVLSNLAAFAVIGWFADRTGAERLEDFRGLSRTNPLMALALMVALFSLAGIPPLAGFTGKYFLFSVASGAGFHWLVATAAINSTVSLYYYLRLIRHMYIEPPATPSAVAVTNDPVTALTVAACALAAVALGIIPTVYETIHSQTVSWFISH